MLQDSAKITEFPDQSPVAQARAKLGMALEHLETTVLARMEEAAKRVAAVQAEAQQADRQEEVAQWKNACRMLEEQLASLKDENSRLHSELHQLRGEVTDLHSRNATLEKASASAAEALEDAITQVENILKD